VPRSGGATYTRVFIQPGVLRRSTAPDTPIPGLRWEPNGRVLTSIVFVPPHWVRYWLPPGLLRLWDGDTPPPDPPD
jgi:hypothetical protein